MVYEDAEKLYAEVRKDGVDMLEEAFDSLFSPTNPMPKSNEQFNTSVSGNIIAYNTTMFPRLEVAAVPLTGSGGSKLKGKVVQASKDGTVGFALLHSRESFSPAVSRGLFSDCDAPSGTPDIFNSNDGSTYCFLLAFASSSGDFIIGNSCVQLTIKDGRITSLFDKHIG